MVRECLIRMFFVLWTLAMTVGMIGVAVGEEVNFRVDSAVYQGERKEPLSRSATIFCDGAIYDCMTTPAETVVFERGDDRFVLLNPNGRTRTELTAAELAELAGRMQTIAAKSKDPLVQFLAKPNFQESFNEAAGELTLASPWVTYRLVLVPESNPDIVRQYQEFCDYYARLNAVLSPGSLPPFGRLVVNAALARRGATASQVFLTIRVLDEDKDKELKRRRIDVRSEHRVVCPLEQADLDRVAEIRGQMDQFKPIRISRYRAAELR